MIKSWNYGLQYVTIHIGLDIESNIRVLIIENAHNVKSENS